MKVSVKEVVVELMYNYIDSELSLSPPHTHTPQTHTPHTHSHPTNTHPTNTHTHTPHTHTHHKHTHHKHTTHTHTTKTHIHTQGRTGDAAVEVLKSVRFPNMSRDYLMHIVDTEQIIKQNSECLKMVSSPLNP